MPGQSNPAIVCYLPPPKPGPSRDMALQFRIMRLVKESVGRQQVWIWSQMELGQLDAAKVCASVGRQTDLFSSRWPRKRP